MSKPRPPEAVKLLVSNIYKDGDLLKDILQALSANYGDIDFATSRAAFHYTAYYEEEMGSPLDRRFVFFRDLISPESLPDVKLCTNAIEEQTSILGKRKANIDPGYI
ncbi:MAG TPA: DUF4416 family protein, partial [Syntrophales bacterium]|nr:DUF4416 family protein [Syntrophales bacterium]